MGEPGKAPGRPAGAVGFPARGTFRRRILGCAARTCASIAVAASFAACGAGEPVHVPEADLPSNVALVRSLVNGIGRAVLDSVAQRMGDTVLLDMDSTASSWIVRTEFASLLGAGGRRVLTGAPDGGPAPTRWSVRGASLTVDYRDIRKPGIFSGPVANRVVSAGITSEVTAGGTIVFAGTMSRSVTDTVPEERIAGIETGSTGIATGKIPDLRSLDRYIEPFVIIGAAGVAILLFFQVRS